MNLFKNMIAAFMLCCFTSSIAFANGVIYQAFNEKFTNLVSKLPELKDIGYEYIQVSPPTKSADLEIWWARYQPIDLEVIDSPLGNEVELRELISKAHDLGLKVLVDVVFNHMADSSFNGGTLNFPQFSPWDFRDADRKPCITNYRNRYEVTHFWLCDLRLGHYLPDLNTASTYVRETHRKYLDRLMVMGVDGFRFDAVKHIESEYFAYITKGIPAGKFYYGEVIGESLNESNEYTPYMRVTDFHLLRVMLGAFSSGGDIRNLLHPEGFGAALPGRDSVVFAKNHDTAMHKGFFNFGDYQDSILASAYLLGRGVGIPHIYRDDYNNQMIKSGVNFYNHMRDQSTYVHTADTVCRPASACRVEDVLFIERGGVGLTVINKANQWLDVEAARVPLQQGCYIETTHNFKIEVMPGSDGGNWISMWAARGRGGLNVGPRSALFFRKISGSGC
jgi:alpha-amylase